MIVAFSDLNDIPSEVIGIYSLYEVIDYISFLHAYKNDQLISTYFQTVI